MTVLSNMPEETNNELRQIGEKLLFISQSLHAHTHKLERAVEGNYAGQSSDPRVRLLSDSLYVSKSADLELGRVNQKVQRVIKELQEQTSRSLIADIPTNTPGNKASGERQVSDEEREALTTSINILERKRSELETLYDIARMLNSTLEFDNVLRLVMDQVIEVVNAERGYLVLINRDTKKLEFKIARNREAKTIPESAFKISQSIVKRVVQNKKPVVTDDAQIDFSAQASVVAYGIRSIMCAPLMVRDECIGAVYVDSLMTARLFTPNHGDLLQAFCNQAAIAIDNARLFADLNRTIKQVNEDKQYMDNIFSSIANGVITTDSIGRITTFNNAASAILRVSSSAVVGQHYQEAFKRWPQLDLTTQLQMAQLAHDHGTIVPYSIDCEISGRGTVNLNIYVSSLRDNQQDPIGMAVVVDDRTELKRSEAEVKQIRRIFGRYVHPNVVKQLIEDPKALNLGGETKEITVIFADIRGYTSLSEKTSPEDVMHMLNSYLEIMVKEIWEEEGTLTSFIGDALMAIFNAPLPQEDHALRAVRAAWKMRLAVQDYQRKHPQENPISFGFGVNTGQGVVGNLGSKNYIQNYTAIGDVVNVASRLQSNASNNDILLNHSTFTRVRKHVNVSKMPSFTVKNRTEPLDVWLLKGMV